MSAGCSSNTLSSRQYINCPGARKRGFVSYWPIATDDALTASRRFRGIADMDRFSSRNDLWRMTLSDYAAYARRATSYHQPWPPRRRALPDWESQLRWKKEPKPSSRQTLPLGWRVTKPPWGWLFSTATNSVR